MGKAERGDKKEKMKNFIKNAVHFFLGIKTQGNYHGKNYEGDASSCPIVGKNHDPKSYGYEKVLDEDGWTTLRPIDTEEHKDRCKEVCDGTCSCHETLVEGESTKEHKKKEDKK